jgi:hypothetical protein
MSKEVFHGDVNITQSAYFSAKAGLGVLFELNRTVYINPEVSYSLPLTALSKEGNWKVSAVEGSLGLLFAL